MNERPLSLDDLTALHSRAKRRHEEELRDSTADLFGQMFKEADAQAMSAAFGGASSDAQRDRLRSESDSLRANDLEMRRALGQDLTPEEEAERSDLASRRTESGYYRPQDAA